MTLVAIQELRDHLSQYLEAARQGEEVVVTEKGRPIVRLLGVQDGTEEKAIERLVSAGRIVPPSSPRDLHVPAPLEATGKPLSQIVIEDRG